MAGARGKIITGHIARLTFLDAKAKAAGIRKITDRRFIMYVFRDSVHLKATVKQAMDESRKAGVPVELDVFEAAVQVGKQVRWQDGTTPLHQAIAELNGDA